MLQVSARGACPARGKAKARGVTRGQSQDLGTCMWRVGLSQQEPNPVTVGGSLEDAWGWGGVVWCGEGWREVQMGFSFPSMWGLWLLHWGSELSFRLFRASSSSFLARGGWWGDDPFFCLHSPPDAAFYYSAGAYLGLSQCFGHTD